jgi:GAF domain-containing protein/CheY-like chemotaxis protein
MTRAADGRLLRPEGGDATSADRLQALADLARLLSETLDPEVVGRRAADSVCKLLNATSAVLYRLDPESERLYEVARGDQGPRFELFPVLERGVGIAGLALDRRAPVASPDILADPRLVYPPEMRARVSPLPQRALIGAPLQVQGRILGVLVVAAPTGRVYTEEEIRLAQSFADQAAAALENARLYDDAARGRREAERVADLARTINASRDLGTILPRCVGAARDLCGADVALIGLREPGAEEAVLDYAVGVLHAHGRPRIKPGESLSGLVLATGCPVRVEDFATDPRIGPQYREMTRQEELRTGLLVPIPGEERVEGFLLVARRLSRPFTERDEATLARVADHAALAIRNARLYTETARLLDESRALLEVARILNSTLDSKRMLREVAITIARVCLVDRCSVSRWDGEAMLPLMSQFADGRKRPDLWQAFAKLSPTRLADVPAYARAVEGRCTVIIDDTSRSDDIPRRWVDVFDSRSHLVTPLIRQGQVIGLLILDVGGQPRPFQRFQIKLAEAIAGQLALAVANSRLFEEARERLRETEVLLSVSAILSASEPSHEILRRVAREVGRALDADTVGVYELDPREGSLTPIAGYHVPSAILETFASRRFILERDSAFYEAWQAGRAAWSSNVLTDPQFCGVQGLPESAMLFAPTMIRGKATGAIFAVWWQLGREFRPSEVRLIEGVAAQVGLAMDNAELARATQMKLEETKTLLTVSRAVSSTLQLSALLRHFLRPVARTVGADTVGAWLLTQDGQWLEPVAGYRVPPAYRDVYRRFRLPVSGNEPYAEAVRTKRPVVERDLGEQSTVDPLMAPFSYRSYLFVPIVAKERVVGGFAAVWWSQARDFSESELALIGAIASQAGIAIDNARLFEENRRQVEELTVLHALSRALTGQLDRAAVLEVILSQVPRVFAVPSIVVVFPSDSGELEVVARRRDGANLGAIPEPCPEGPAGGLKRLVFEEGRAIRTDDYAGECARRGVQPVEDVVRFPHWMGVPLRAGDTVLGVIGIGSADRSFTEADERLLTNITDLAALALRSVRLFTERTRAYGELAAAQDQLVRTEKLRALGEMASGVAHDFNNLLAAILGRAQLMQREVADPRHRQWLEVIERSAIDGAHTVRRLQEFTRIRRDPPLVAVDVNRIAREALEMTQSRWRDDVHGRGVIIEIRTALGPVPEIAGDPVELREVLTNLILNAVDAMPKGGLLSVASVAVGTEVHLTVTDSGIGMSDAVRRRIFDPFFTTKGPQGTGLGLAMTYGIIARHGGRIEVESEEGHGSTFRLVFPGTRALAVPPEPQGEPLVAPTALACLVVDDEVSVGTLLGDVFESGGHRAVVCVDGADAIARFRAERFDVVFTDLAMPGVSGWQVARAVKAIAPDVPVFIVTGFGVELSPEECRAHGVDAVLTKPLSIQELLDTVARVARAVAARHPSSERRTP